ncbi:hydrogenase maturation nickel metallochaperone HypA [Amycolatopsis sp. GM8]|uniref:hydrogenase maturation nickel metallochaperone HypA/HybF n=1 Tax=Amycolatopsis sp. GM8 TaxID=2896530 RepID=UPI001F330138|nr:hydrogenase maturation nickel metallochaperone HypA [Amycolatopsis sp. GM8]
MHELSITRSVVETILERTGETKVLDVSLEIGKLSGVVADSVRFCFELVCAGTPLEGAALHISEPGGRAHCRTCGEEFTMDDLIPLCPCGSADIEMLTGRELRITSVEVV